MSREIVVRAATASDRDAILGLADRLPAFGPTTRSAAEIAERERRELDRALSEGPAGTALFVAEHRGLGVVGVILLDTRRDYFTNETHGHVSILAVARAAEGQGVGRALLAAAEEWAHRLGFRRLTLAVFTENERAKAVYRRQGWEPELETFFKQL